jgi:hypothetical protein
MRRLESSQISGSAFWERWELENFESHDVDVLVGGFGIMAAVRLTVAGRRVPTVTGGLADCCPIWQALPSRQPVELERLVYVPRYVITDHSDVVVGVSIRESPEDDSGFELWSDHVDVGDDCFGHRDDS